MSEIKENLNEGEKLKREKLTIVCRIKEGEKLIPCSWYKEGKLIKTEMLTKEEVEKLKE